MEDILRFNTITEYNTLNNTKTLNPLVSLIHFEDAEPRKLRRMYYGFYAIFLKQVKCGDLRYGLNYYDYQEGTMVFLAPGQVIGDNLDEIYQPKGYALVFHPDLLRGTTLAKTIEDYTFFSYASNESLHLSDKEKEIIMESFSKIEYEIAHTIDKHSKKLIVSNIELLLNYCMRFYDRQFITRENVHKGSLERFESLLKDYFQSDKPQNIGLPTVGYFAEQLHLSTNYFGDMFKKETGKTVKEYILLKLIDLAKEKIFDRSKSINEIAYELGFKYPQHFTRLFKNETGYTPNEYRSLN
jgi:AraC-like DNA-binding protein